MCEHGDVVRERKNFLFLIFSLPGTSPTPPNSALLVARKKKCQLRKKKNVKVVTFVPPEVAQQSRSFGAAKRPLDDRDAFVVRWAASRYPPPQFWSSSTSLLTLRPPPPSLSPAPRPRPCPPAAQSRKRPLPPAGASAAPESARPPQHAPAAAESDRDIWRAVQRLGVSGFEGRDKKQQGARELTALGAKSKFKE